DVYFAPDAEPGQEPPDGFDGVLTGAEWRGVGAFADAVDGQIVTSYPSNTGARDSDDAWLDEEARKRLAFDPDNDIAVVAAELDHESNLPIGFPDGYDADAFARDFATFTALVRAEAPEMRIVGPSTANDIDPNVLPASIRSADILELIASDLDVFSYHF